MRALEALVIAFAGVTGCGGSPPPSPAAAPIPTVSGLRAVPLRAAVGSRSFTLESYTWLNLEIRVVPDDSVGLVPPNRPLNVLFWLRPDGRNTAFAGIQMMRGYVVWGDSIWSDSVSPHSPTSGNARPGTMAGGFRGGPLWMLRDDSADVVIEIRDSISKQAVGSGATCRGGACRVTG